MAIFKAHVLVTFLLEGTLDDSKQIIESMSLLTIAGEMDDGEFVGTHELVLFDEVHPDDIAAELAEMGNDGSFFDVPDSTNKPNP